MASRTGLFFARFTAAVLCGALLFTPPAHAQQTLGGISGTVTDNSGGVIPATTVTIVSDQTKLTRTLDTSTTGSYNFVNLPIGSYTITFTAAGFQALKVPSIQVQANRTATVNATLKVGEVTQTVTVEETPLINEVDTTNGYVMDKSEIEDVPLPTGSFTGLALLSAGVNAELPGGSGANAGLGNAPIWANGQRDTSNTFLLNGVDGRSLFNGKTTSQVLSARVVNNTGTANTLELSAVPEQSSSSVYLAIGESLPSPPPEAITEVRVNTSMYDAQQGSTSGAHIDMSTASGTNNIHGSIYLHRGTNWLNADPFFYNADPNTPASEKNPELHRYIAGGTVGLPIKKDKLFLFVSYQYTHASDAEIGISRAVVPLGLGAGTAIDGTSCTTRGKSQAAMNCLAAIANGDSAPALGDPTFDTTVGTLANGTPASIGIGPGQMNPIAYTLFNYQLPNGQYLIPAANPNSVVANLTANPLFYSPNVAVDTAMENAFPEDAEVPGTALFQARQAVTNLDWNPNSAHAFAVKYYYQDDPTTAPYAYSMYPGFSQHLAAGSQVAALSHTQIVKNNLSITETFGFVRERAYSSISEPFTPSQFATACQSLTGASAADCTIDTFGSSVFPGIGIVGAMENADTEASLPYTLAYPYSMQLGATGQYLGAFTGVHQNRFNPSANAIWTLGKHTITFGGSFSYTQLNTIDNRTQLGTIASNDFAQFLGGALAGALTNDYYNVTSFLVGDANRYWRANESGEYFQDKYQFRPNLNITAGLRIDWDGGLTEKYGRLLNFDPSKYDYNPTTDTIVSNGLIVAGNNAQAGTPGVSNSTLTGRQWGFAPRLGIAWSPKVFNNKLVVRAGWGMYYDRGELFSYLSPGFTANIATGGPFGVNESQPFANLLTCGVTAPCAANGGVPTLENPWGTSADLAMAQPVGNPGKIILPNACALASYNNPNPPNCTPSTANATPFYMADYARNNSLPYTMNATLDIQWQPRNDLAIDIGYVNALGRHEVIPIPFNQSRIASPSSPLCGPAAVCANPTASPFAQSYTYGYTVQSATAPCASEYTAYNNNCPINLPNGQTMLANPESGNVDLRVPYMGLAAESEQYTAEGVSSYNALQTHIEKRLSHGLQIGASYTFSRSLDEQSGLGLFYNGNNPLNIRDGYGPSDFDRTHVFNIDYHYDFPKFIASNSWKSQIADGWAIQGVVIVQSGQPYSVVDYSGAVGGAFYGVSDGITNPILPIDTSQPGCSTYQSVATGAVGNLPGSPALNAACFTIPLLYPCDSTLVANPQKADGSVPCAAIPSGDSFETNFTSGQRNIFRQSWQRRADISLVKLTKLTERFTLKYSFDVYNLTNTPSFDVPIDNVTQNVAFSDFPMQSSVNPVPGSTTCGSNPGAGGPFSGSAFYNCPRVLGQVTNTIGSSRQVQMSLALTF